MLRNVVVPLFALVLVGLAACGSGEATPKQAPAPAKAPPPPPTSAKPERPAGYTMLCAICHGPEAKGYAADHAPSLVSATFLESASDQFLHDAIANGRPGTSMAAYSKTMNGPLDEVAIKEIITWLRAQAATPPKPLPDVAPTVGDAKRGATVYTTYCQTCHGDSKARGEGVSLGNVQFLRTASRAFVRHAIVNGRAPTKMEAWKDRLTAQQIDDVVAFIFDGLGQLDNLPPQQLPAPTGNEPLVINPNGATPKFSPRSDPCPPTDPKCAPNNRYIPMAQVADALAKKQKLIIIDARPESDWMRVHVTGAVSIPYHDQKRLAEIKNDGTWVIAYCACPHHLSGEIVDALRAKGIKTSAILDEGILEWHRNGYPVVAAAGVQPPPKQVPEGPPIQ